MQLTPLLQYPMYQMSDAFGGFEDEQKAQGAWIDANVPGRFATRSAADSYYGAFTAQGGVLVDGMSRYIAGYPETYRVGAWRGVMPATGQTSAFFATTYNGAAETGVASLNIADPGVSYFLDCSGDLNLSANAGTQCEAYLRLDTIAGQIAGAVRIRSGALPDGELISLTFARYRIGPLTGAHTLLMSVQRKVGSGNWSVLATGNLLRADIIPV